VDREIIQPIRAQEEQWLFEKFRAIVDKEHWDGLIFQDYNKGVLSKTLIEKIIELCRDRSIKTAVDPKLTNFYAYRGTDLFKPNLHELTSNLPFKVATTIDGLSKAAAFVRKKTDSKVILFTLSDKGIFIDFNGKQHLLPVKKKEITDVCGAGDAVISMASMAYACGLSGYEIAYWANLAGSIACEYPGVVPVDFKKIGRDLT
jgi:rfaE bifunctional protein kinase chain/domain